jgi:coproporphyrinogen III oxidase
MVPRGFNDDPDCHRSAADFDGSRVKTDHIADEDRSDEIYPPHGSSHEKFIGLHACLDASGNIKMREYDPSENSASGIGVPGKHGNSNRKYSQIIFHVAHKLIILIFMKQLTREFFSSLQDTICQAIEKCDTGAQFREDLWNRKGGGGGRTRILENGAVFEKAGVNFSAVEGLLPEEFAKKIAPGIEGAQGREFFATGISLVLHPQNPFVPTVHANFRYLEKGQGSWFGGGTDLTPYYPILEDIIHFHRTLKEACDKHNADYYLRFKKSCDEYFYIRHRGETRGVGGIFFDYLQGEPEKVFAFVRETAEAFLPAYLPIVERRRDQAYGEREREFQLIRRGRYVEFNLVYDRGTAFGLETEGRTESILMSLPPLARWFYDYHPDPLSPEAAAWSYFKPQDWLGLESQ